MFRIAWHPVYVHPLPENHRFPMIKYELLPQQLLRLGIVKEDWFFEPSEGFKYPLTVHEQPYLNRLFTLQLHRKEERASGFPQSRALVERELRITNGTVEAAQTAIEHGVAFNIAGGTHHALSNAPEGFCLLNDQAVSSSYLLEQGLAQRILIVDLDVHQGNGTAEIFRDEPRVFTFSMHGEKNYPYRKPPSNLDIPLPDNTGDKEYLAILRQNLPEIIDLHKPDFIFFQAGVDVLEDDKLGRLALSIDGCRKRDEVVFKACYKHKIPVMVTMGGGYSEDIKTILEAHCNTYRAASAIYE